MESNSYLISPDSQYRQRLSMVLTESEIRDLHRFLTDAKKDCLYWPKVAEELKFELWYSYLEVHIENTYQAKGGER